jgi:hypothetical protein
MKQPTNDVEINNFLEEIASGAIPLKGWQHPLGFVHVKVLINGNDDEKVRLRFWETKSDISSLGVSDRIHNHAFDFVSHILSGEVLERRYELVLDPRGTHRIWEVENLGGKSVLRKTTIRCVLKESDDIVHPFRSSYTMTAGLFHDAISNADCTATLVFETPRPEIASLVICPKDVEKLTDNKWPEVSQEEIITFVKRILEKRRSS